EEQNHHTLAAVRGVAHQHRSATADVRRLGGGILDRATLLTLRGVQRVRGGVGVVVDLNGHLDRVATVVVLEGGRHARLAVGIAGGGRGGKRNRRVDVAGLDEQPRVFIGLNRRRRR